MGEYGIVANVSSSDSCLRMSSKAYLIGGAGGQGYERFEWFGRSRGGRLIVKWVTTKRFNNFRCAWIPEHVRKAAHGCVYLCGTREQVERLAIALNKTVENL